MPFGDQPITEELPKLKTFDELDEKPLNFMSSGDINELEELKAKRKKPAAKLELALEDQIHAAVYWLDTHTRAQIASPISDEHKRMERYVKFLAANSYLYELKPPAPSSVKRIKKADPNQKKLL